MANHLTPEELSEELGLEREEVIRVCVEEGVPIYQGKIDKYLFQAQLRGDRAGATPPRKIRRQALLRAGVLREREPPASSRGGFLVLGGTAILHVGDAAGGAPP